VAVDEEAGLITIAPADGVECTVSLNSDYGHPITTLLGTYFSDVNAEDLTDALDATEVCVVEDPDDVWTISEPAAGDECSGEMVTVTGDNEDDDDGTFSAQPEEGDPITLTVEDEGTAGDLTDALNSLAADWELEDGSVVDVGDAIGDYHDAGYGFGVLVKVYAIIEELEAKCTVDPPPNPPPDPDLCETTVGDLIDLLDGDEGEGIEGMGMGDLFAIYGKPSMTGVGHVRNADGSSGGDGNGVCNARSQGGAANATGQNVDCGTTIPNTNKDKDKSNKGGDGDDEDDD
jgi:hypothetical protein